MGERAKISAPHRDSSNWLRVKPALSKATSRSYNKFPKTMPLSWLKFLISSVLSRHISTSLRNYFLRYFWEIQRPWEMILSRHNWFKSSEFCTLNITLNMTQRREGKGDLIGHFVFTRIASGIKPLIGSLDENTPAATFPRDSWERPVKSLTRPMHAWNNPFAYYTFSAAVSSSL